MTTEQRHPGVRLRFFRDARKISLREAARQLHVAHPALKDWEAEDQVPTKPYRDAIEVWTNGEIKAGEWPLSIRERQIVANAGRVEPVRAPDSGPSVADAAGGDADDSVEVAEPPAAANDASKSTGTGG